MASGVCRVLATIEPFAMKTIGGAGWQAESNSSVQVTQSAVAHTRHHRKPLGFDGARQTGHDGEP